MRTTFSLSVEALRPNPRQQLLRRLIVRILRHQPALESALQDALPQPGCTLQARFNLRFDFVHNGQTAINFGDDLLLLINRGKQDRSSSQLIETEMRTALTVNVPLELPLPILT